MVTLWLLRSISALTLREIKVQTGSRALHKVTLVKTSKAESVAECARSIVSGGHFIIPPS